MTAPDCPYGENNIPKEDDKQYGFCIRDANPCWNKECSLESWQENKVYKNEDNIDDKG